MLNRRGFFKAAAAGATVAAVGAEAPAVGAEVAVVPEVPEVAAEPGIPDGLVVGLGERALRAIIEDEALRARTQCVYASLDQSHSVMLSAMYAAPDQWRKAMDDTTALIKQLKAENKVVLYFDNGFDPVDYGFEWPHPDNGEWQSFPFVSYADEEVRQGRPRPVHVEPEQPKRIRAKRTV